MLINSSNTNYQVLRKTMVLPFVLAVITFTSMNCTSKDINKEVTDTTTQTTVGGEQVYEKVEIEAGFPGGLSGWRAYLQKNLNVLLPVDNGAPEGEYTVTVQFIVNKDGKISHLKTLTNHGFGMEEEVLRTMTKSPDWEPAIQDGKKVNAYRIQPITFAIQAE